MAKDYWTCPYCKANLDHDEKCTCKDKEVEEEKKDGCNNQN